jgi:tetratricopeptide (TPR) repeat protein
MKKILLALAFTIASVISVSAQREYSYCRHAYCYALHLYGVAYNFTPTIVKAVINTTEANPYNRLTCETTNKLALKHFYKGADSLHRYRVGFKSNHQPEQLKMAMIYFQGAIKEDNTFCDAYDNLVDCFYRAKQYDSAVKVIDKQKNPSFHSQLAKGVIYYDIYNDYSATEQYFKTLCETSRPTSIYYFYMASSEVMLKKLDAAKESLQKMDSTIAEWGDGWAMTEKQMFLKGVIACKEQEYDKAYELLDRIKNQYDALNPVFCHYYGLALQHKTKPSKSKAEKLEKRAIKLNYNADVMM